MKHVKYIKDLKVIKSTDAEGVVLIKARGITEMKKMISASFTSISESKIPTKDGILELDFVLGSLENEVVAVELEFDVAVKLKAIPDWVKGIKVNALENSDIEIL